MLEIKLPRIIPLFLFHLYLLMLIYMDSDTGWAHPLAANSGKGLALQSAAYST